MKLPDYIMVGPFRYKVEEIGPADFESDEGGIIHSKLVIRIHAAHCAGEFVLDTLWHEISHAVNNVAGVEDDTKEEEQVTRTTPVWLQVIRDNHALFKLLSDYRAGLLSPDQQ